MIERAAAVFGTMRVHGALLMQRCSNTARCTCAGATVEQLSALRGHECSAAAAQAFADAESPCPICLGAFCAGETLSSLPCGHEHHRACLIEWLRLSASCPLCKCACNSAALRPQRAHSAVARVAAARQPAVELVDDRSAHSGASGVARGTSASDGGDGGERGGPLAGGAPSGGRATQMLRAPAGSYEADEEGSVELATRAGETVPASQYH